MEITKYLSCLALFLPLVYGAPAQAASSLQPEILAAMKRDLGLDAEQANARVARDLEATEIIEHLRSSTGDSFAGAWIGEDGHTINVAVTDEALTEEVVAAGAKPAIKATPLAKLEKAKKALDKLDIDQPSTLDTSSADVGIAAYYVDVNANKLVIEALADSVSHAESLAEEVGLDASEYEVRTVGEMPSPLATIQGGDAYLINSSGRCSVGFTVTTGFISAGHCGRVGATASTTGGASLGTFAGSNFPGSDMAYIRTSSGHTLRGTINRYGQSAVSVSGSTVSALGASVCRSGSTTGVSCGTIRAYGATVNYAQGRVTGLTQTTVCAERGDSGGPFYTGSQAQGVTSGGSGDCTSGGVTYFQPVGPILRTYGVTLVRG